MVGIYNSSIQPPEKQLPPPTDRFMKKTICTVVMISCVNVNHALTPSGNLKKSLVTSMLGEWILTAWGEHFQ
jgi:hypothetical protein